MSARRTCRCNRPRPLAGACGLTPAEAEKIKAALESFGCTGGKMEKEDEDATLPYEVDDAKCKSGEYDIKLDKNFNVIIMLRD